ncbi:MAG TPA: glutamate--tRNA ligase [Caulobacteraceae bacterium]|jgi:glutamyl-tRNA synthetase
MSDPASPIVTRFAPSPTGNLHIGGGRTALFNYLYARHTGGKFLLRIEDTDRERSTPDAVKAIFDGLAWLGLAPDEEPVFQHGRAGRHAEVALALLQRGGAYRCYMTVEQLAEEREKARTEGRPIRSPWRDRGPGAGANQPFVVRLRAPLEGETIVDDLVKGRVAFRNAQLDDLILLRADGSPTYNLAVVADDHDMGITYVIRGDDHLNNAARQTLIYQGMGWALPKFGHLPMIHGPDGAKLSKRHGAQAVGEFADMGYLPEAMRNYLARLGWGHGDDEIFSDAEATGWFDIADVVSAPARLDWPKLNHINQHYIREADDERLRTLVTAILRSREVHLPADFDARLARAIPLVKEGAKTTLDLADLTLFALKPRPVRLDDKAAALLTGEVQARLARLCERLAGEADWSSPALHAALKSFADAEGGFGKFGPALRPILAAGAVAPDLASALSALGPDEGLGRIEDALSQVQ